MAHEYDFCICGHPYVDHQPEFGCWADECECPEFVDEDDTEDDGTMVDIGGGMVVPLRELMEDDE